MPNPPFSQVYHAAIQIYQVYQREVRMCLGQVSTANRQWISSIMRNIPLSSPQRPRFLVQVRPMSLSRCPGQVHWEEDNLQDVPQEGPKVLACVPVCQRSVPGFRLPTGVMRQCWPMKTNFQLPVSTFALTGATGERVCVC